MLEGCTVTLAGAPDAPSAANSKTTSAKGLIYISI
jgi:hypothetical protein